jgi:hypothetical protein
MSETGKPRLGQVAEAPRQPGADAAVAGLPTEPSGPRRPSDETPEVSVPSVTVIIDVDSPAPGDEEGALLPDLGELDFDALLSEWMDTFGTSRDAVEPCPAIDTVPLDISPSSVPPENIKDFLRRLWNEIDLETYSILDA